MKKYLLGFLFLTFSQNVLAECGGVGCNDVMLEMVYVTSGKTYLQTSGTETWLTNCAPQGGKLITLRHDHSSADKIYALLLTAYASKLNLRIRTNDTANNAGECTVAYAVLENN